MGILEVVDSASQQESQRFISQLYHGVCVFSCVCMGCLQVLQFSSHDSKTNMISSAADS